VTLLAVVFSDSLAILNCLVMTKKGSLEVYLTLIIVQVVASHNRSLYHWKGYITTPFQHYTKKRMTA
jgi:hypothetical protein